MSTPSFSPIQRLLQSLHDQFAGCRDGSVASYIPELAHADPALFGIAIATVDGHVYEVGDSRAGFTIQSISKIVSYGCALEDSGVDAVLRKIDVEPSGEAFNSISLHPVTGRPRNPMINAGAIATCGTLRGDSPAARLTRLFDAFQRYVGHPVGIDEKVYQSERDTGHRNRALAHLMYGFGILEQPPEEVLDVYFRQCSILVSCRDLALIGACLANGGINPLDGSEALAREQVPKVLSVMASCGMYDASGNWIYHVGMPAKSGVAGGIVAVLPGQMGIGVYSPALDEQGNSVRGIAVCEALSREFGLHLFKSLRATSTSVIRHMHSASQIGSRRLRSPAEEGVLKRLGDRIRVYQLQGELVFGSTESLLHKLTTDVLRADCIVLDLKHVSRISYAATRLFADFIAHAARAGKAVLITDTETQDKKLFCTQLVELSQTPLPAETFGWADADRAVEWCEDRLLAAFRGSPGDGRFAAIKLVDHPLAVGMPDEQFGRLYRIAREVRFAAGEWIVRAGDDATSMFLITDGEVEVFLRVNGRVEKRLTTLGSGMSFGEMAMVNRERRTADVRALCTTTCYEVSFDALDDALRSRLLVNLAQQLSHKLLRVEREIQLIGG